MEGGSGILETASNRKLEGDAEFLEGDQWDNGYTSKSVSWLSLEIQRLPAPQEIMAFCVYTATTPIAWAPLKSSDPIAGSLCFNRLPLLQHGLLQPTIMGGILSLGSLRVQVPSKQTSHPPARPGVEVARGEAPPLAPIRSSAPASDSFATRCGRKADEQRTEPAAFVLLAF